MRPRGIIACASALAVLLVSGCGSTATTAPGAAPPTPVPISSSTDAPPTDGPTDLPPTPPNTPPALDRIDTMVSENSTGPVTDQATTSYASDMLHNADRLWTKWFKQAGLPEPYVWIELVQPAKPYSKEGCWVSTPSGTRITVFPSDFRNAMYCDVENGHGTDKGVIIIPIQALAKLWTGDIYGRQVPNPQAVGDFAAGVVLSHEFGHHIAAEIGAYKKLPRLTGKNKELLADCFAGVHAYSLSLGVDGHLDPGDLDEGLAALAALGDTANSTDPHGTPAERQNAFNVGLRGTTADQRPAVPNNCLKNFWPEAAFAG